MEGFIFGILRYTPFMRKFIIIFSLSAKITVETRPGTTSTNISPSTSTPTSPMTTSIPSPTKAMISVSISLFQNVVFDFRENITCIFDKKDRQPC